MAHGRRRSIVWLAALMLLLAACGSTGSPPTPPATQQLPPAPTDFTAKLHAEYAPCPSPNPDDFSCSQTDLTWQSTADPGTWFRIYTAGTGQGDDPVTCSDVRGEAQLRLETKPGARSAQLISELSTGGGETCLWITAVNDAGESTQVPATGQ